MIDLFTLLWVIATFTIILFCYYFLKEVNSNNALIQISLKGVIVFTAVIIILSLPLDAIQIVYNSAYMIFDLSSFFIVLLFFIFLINFHNMLNEEFRMLKFLSFILILGFGISLIFGLISNYHYIYFLITGNTSNPLDVLAPIANLAGLITMITEFLFLFQLRKINNYKNLLIK